MLDMIRKRRGDEEGFTLIELMVVVLIIAILLAIAIPTFLGARTRANDRAAQSNIRNAMTAEKTLYTDNQVYSATPATLTAIEPNLTYVNAVPATFAANTVYLASATPFDTVLVGARSASNKCYWMQDVATTGTKWSTDTACAVPLPGTFNSSTAP